MDDFTFEVANADFITGFLIIGGDLDENTERAVYQAVELVDDAGVTHVLDARFEAEERLWEHFPAVSYRWEGIKDAGQRVPASWFEQITAWADDAIDAGGTVLAHCHMGVNRGPSAGYAILLRRGWDPVDAIDTIRKARPQAFVAYAEDALEWHLTRTRATPTAGTGARMRLAEWRQTHPMDVARAIRNGSRRDGGRAA